MSWAATRGSRKHAVDFQVPANRILDDKFWTDLGAPAELSMREKIIYVTIDDLGRVGPSTFNVKLVCEALGVSFSLINHHFGNRDELIAEATIRAYQGYVNEIWAAARAKSTPEARLRAWLEASVAWSRKYSGLGALLNYPTASLDVTQIITDKWQPTLSSWGELNMARLHQLTIDVSANEVSDVDIVLGAIPLSTFRKNPRAMKVTASVGWSILGMAVWNAGKHLPTGEIEDARLNIEQNMAFHLDRIIEIAKLA